jgi:outer membrane protein assembly factor BamA
MRLFFIFFILITTLVLNAQGKYYVNSIEIEGNKTTKKSTVLRELSFQIGDSLTLESFSEKVVQSELNISSQWLFNFIDIIPTYSENNIDVVIKVVERWYV